MKKLLLFAGAISLAACGNTETKKCQYTKMTNLTINLNKMPGTVLETETTEGCYSITKTATDAELTDSKSDFSIKLSTNPIAMKVTKGEEVYDWKNINGFKVSNTMSGDTLILQYMPTWATPESVLKYGKQYKFYN